MRTLRAAALLILACSASCALPAQGGPDGVWTAFSPPRNRVHHLVMHDAPRDRIVVVGGVDVYTGDVDVWAMSLSGRPSWTLLNSTGPRPVPRARWQGALDAAGQRIILFGGGGYTSTFQDVWTFNLNGTPAWTQLAVLGVPPTGRAEGTMIHDPARNRVILFGGRTPNGTGYTAHADVWELRLSDPPVWNPLSPAGPGPSPRFGHTAIHDAARNRMVVFGGGASVANNEVWALSLGGSPAWTYVGPGGASPAPRQSHSAVFDPVADAMVVYGGYSGQTRFADTWRYSLGASPSWTELLTSNTPEKRNDHAAAYDPLRERMVVVGGSSTHGYLEDVHALSLTPGPTWTALWPLDSLPISREGAFGVLDPVRHRMIVTGGKRNPFGPTIYLNDTWALDLQGSPAWTPLATSGPRPSARVFASVVYDPEDDRMLLFGGLGTTHRNDLWSLSFSTSMWTEILEPSPLPPARYGATAILDPARQRMLVFGGYPNSDMWAWSLTGTGWSAVTSAGPTPAEFLTAIHDPVRDRIVGLAGYASRSAWSFTLSGAGPWTPMSTSGSPPNTSSLNGVYDPAFDRLLITFSNKTWELPFATNTWRALTPDGTPPPENLYGPATVFDTPRQRLLVMGGGVGGSERGEVRVLEFGSPLAVETAGPATTLELSAAVPNPARGTVSFSVALAASANVTANVFDVTGRQVRNISTGRLEAGRHPLLWNSRDERGVPATQGIYFLRVRAGGAEALRRFIVLR